jgi:hypothetical protein
MTVIAFGLIARDGQPPTFLRAGIALKKSCHHPGQRTSAT